MIVGLLLIAIGLTTIVWGRWTVPRWLKTVRSRATPSGAERYDAFFDRPAVRGLFASSVVVGCVVTTIGILYLVL